MGVEDAASSYINSCVGVEDAASSYLTLVWVWRMRLRLTLTLVWVWRMRLRLQEIGKLVERSDAFNRYDPQSTSCLENLGTDQCVQH